MRILLTRSAELCEKTANALTALGHEVFHAPTNTPIAVGSPPQDANVYIVSSQNGVFFGLANLTNKDVKVFAVGDETTKQAKSMGFNVVVRAADSKALLTLIQQTISPQVGQIIHLSGAHMARDIAGCLSSLGYDAHAAVVYEAVATSEVNPAIMQQFKEGHFDRVLFYSARAVTTFEAWVKAHSAESGYEKTTAAVLSKRIANALSPQWKKQQISAEPNEKSLFKCAEVYQY